MLRFLFCTKKEAHSAWHVLYLILQVQEPKGFRLSFTPFPNMQFDAVVTIC